MFECEEESVRRKQDRRVTRTRQQLCDALVELILEKGYDPVTVSNIAERAHVGRATFYLHYHDKEELLIDSVRHVMDKLVRRMKNDANKLSKVPLTTIFRHASENYYLYYVIHSKQGSAAATRLIREYITKAVLFYLPIKSKDDEGLPTELLALHISGALFSLIEWWLGDDMPYSVEEMVEFCRQMLLFGIACELHSDMEAFWKQTQVPS